MKYKYDWNEIQKFYDQGNSLREVMKKFGINHNKTIDKARKSGRLKTRSQKDSIAVKIKINGPFVKKHSEETKQKISKHRIDYLQKHPDKVPYRLNHSSKRSWPEIVFENALKSLGIVGWISEYQNSIYQYDFAWVDKKIDVEVDGGTHKSEKVKKIDERRDTFSKANGWTVIRFDAQRVKKDVVGCIKELQPYIS